MTPIRLVLLVISLQVITTLGSSDTERCRLDEFEPVSLRAHLSPTVVEATAIERFKYIPKSPSNQRAYSVLFQIKRIFKYENIVYQSNTPLVDSLSSANNQTYFYVSSQSEHSDEINLNSFFLVENFAPHINNNINSNFNLTCHSVNLQMNRNYYMFIDGQDMSVDLADRRTITYPVRVNSLLKSKRKRDKRAGGEEDGMKQKQFAPSKLALFVKMPIFNLSAKPLPADNHFLEQTLERILCQDCVREPVLEMKNAHQIALVNQTAKIECNYSGNPTPNVYWKRQTIDNVNEMINDDFKFTIYTTNEGTTSVLLINEVKPEDEGFYYCMARDFVNGDENNEVTALDRVRLVVRRQGKPPKRNNNNNHMHNNNNSKSKSTGEKINNKNERRKNDRRRKKPLDGTRQRQKQLIEESLSRSQHQTSTHVQTIIHYLTTPTSLLIDDHSPPIKEGKRVDHHSTKPLDLKIERSYVRCSPAQDTCINGGVCYITNPSLFKNNFLYNQSKIKFCVCDKYFEGQNCEISLLKSLNNHRGELPTRKDEEDLNVLWKRLEKPEVSSETK